MNSSSNTGVAGSISFPANKLTSAHEDELWTSKEVAKFLRVSLKTVFNLRKRGLPYVQLGGAVRFAPREIKDYLANSRGLSSHHLRQIIRKGDASL